LNGRNGLGSQGFWEFLPGSRGGILIGIQHFRTVDQLYFQTNGNETANLTDVMPHPGVSSFGTNAYAEIPLF
jgi:hypothetical protein